MRRRTLSISCDGATARKLAMAVRGYANAAYPEGGSDCAQVSRAALLDTAASCDLHGSGDLVLRRRQLAHLRASVRWYFSENGPGEVESGPQLEALLAANNKSTT